MRKRDEQNNGGGSRGGQIETSNTTLFLRFTKVAAARYLLGRDHNESSWWEQEG